MSFKNGLKLKRYDIWGTFFTRGKDCGLTSEGQKLAILRMRLVLVKYG